MEKAVQHGSDRGAIAEQFAPVSSRSICPTLASMLVRPILVLKYTSGWHSIPANKGCTYRAVPLPFYYRRVDRRRQLLTAFGIALVCAIALPLLIFLIHISFFF